MTNIFTKIEEKLKEVFTDEISADKQAEIIAAAKSAVEGEYEAAEGRIEKLETEVAELEKGATETTPVPASSAA